MLCNIGTLIVVVIILCIFHVSVIASANSNSSGSAATSIRLSARNRHHLSSAPIHIVLARYNETLDHLQWLQKYNSARLYTIYNRGETDVPSAWISKNCLENVGRESFIYLSYIIKHFHMLPEVVVFSQVSENDRSSF
jgi:hypothetical protein